ncbi:hypothetical protein IC582_023702 [Cucumis melo]
MNIAGPTAKLGRKDGENFTRKIDELSNRRNGDHEKKTEEVERSFRCRECEGFNHYKAECPTFLRRQKKNYYATLSDEDSDDNEVDHGLNVFTTCITKINLDDSECSDKDENEDLTFEELKMLRKEDSEARAIQKERIQDLMEENERLMGVISSLKIKLKKVQSKYDQTIKSIKMLNSGTENLDSILNSGQNSSSKYGLGFDASLRNVKSTSEVKFVFAAVKAKTEITCTTAITNPSARSFRWTCYYRGRKGHIRPFCYKLQRDKRYQQKREFESHKNKSSFAKHNRSIRKTHMVWRVKTSENCKIAFTTVQTTNDAWYFDSGCSRHMTGNR